jgi:peroxiredoxin
MAAVDWAALPAPEDDGAAAHLEGLALPAVALPCTQGAAVDLSALTGRLVVYTYPMTASPGVPPPDGWDFIPGAKGCTPQSCAFRDHSAELRALGVDHLYGVSTQSKAEQAEAGARLALDFGLLSDAELRLAGAMRLPIFQAAGRTLLKRLAFVACDGRIEKVFYPVFPPDRNAQDVIDWLRGRG